MKSTLILIMAALSFGSLRATTIEGTLFRLSADALVLKGVRVLRQSPHQKNEDPLTISYVDYRGTLEGVEFFVREGVGVDMLDPGTPTAKVARLGEWNAGNYHIYDVICSEDGVFVCGVLIESKTASAPNPETRGSGVYLAVRGSDPKQLAAALSRILDEIHLGLSGSAFERIGGTAAAVEFKELIGILEMQK
jgi:hypothetical protein